MTPDSAPRIIAIDGPSASGKSTVARLVAKAIGGVYVDSGSLYRGMTWQAVRRGVDLSDPEAVIACMEASRWDFIVEEGSLAYYIDGDAPGDAIRGSEVTDRVSLVAAIPAVRHFVTETLREQIRCGDLAIEGRDIGSAVFPDTPYKFYLDADPAERARRRQKDHAQIGEEQDQEAVQQSLERRDQLDSTRKTAPLQVALGAQTINSTALSAEEVAAEILRVVRGG